MQARLTYKMSLLDFDVHTEGGQQYITDFGLAMDASFTDTGLVAIGENATTWPTIWRRLHSRLGRSLSQDKTIAPGLSSIDLRKDILVAGGRDGSASLVSFTETFSEIPEPNFSWMIAAGLPVILSFRKRASAVN